MNCDIKSELQTWRANKSAVTLPDDLDLQVAEMGEFLPATAVRTHAEANLDSTSLKVTIQRAAAAWLGWDKV